MKVGVAIPGYNVATTIEDVVRRTRATGRIDRIVVLDDGSKDDTPRLLRALATDGHIEVVTHEKNRGYGAAQRSLFGAFLEDPRFGPDDAIVFLHGDAEMLPEEIPSMLAPLERDPSVDVTLGSRSPSLARKQSFINAGVRRPGWKVAADLALTSYLNTMFGLSMSTYFGGYRAIRKRAADRIPLEALSHNHFFDIEFIAWAGTALRVMEVPISNFENHSVRTYSSLRLLKDIALLGRRRTEVRSWRRR